MATPLLSIRVHTEDKARWQLAAAREGMSMTAWIHAVLNVRAAIPNPEAHAGVVIEPELSALDKPKAPPRKGLCARCTRIGVPSCVECRK